MMELLPLLGQMVQQVRILQLIPTLLHTFALPPHLYNAMVSFLLTGCHRNDSALPGVGSAEGGGNTCEGREWGISGVVCHSPPSISFQYPRALYSHARGVLRGAFGAYGNPVLSLSTGMALQVVRQGMRRSPVATTTVSPAMSTRSPARRTFRMPPREEAWKARKSVLLSTLLQ